MKKKTIKVKKVIDILSVKGTSYLYALGDDGLIYFVKHDPETNSAEWQQMPSPKIK